MTSGTGTSDTERAQALAVAVCEALELAPIGVAIVSLDGIVLATNGTLRRWAGADRELFGAASALLPTGDVRRRLPRVAAGEAVSFETSRCELVPAVRGNFSVRLSPLTMAGRVVACSVFVTDEQAPVEAPDRPMHERFRDLVDGAADGVIVARGDVLLYANRAARDWLALPGPEDVVGRSLTELFGAESPPGTPGQPGGVHETHLRRADGAEVAVAVSVARVRLPEGVTTVLVLRRRAPARGEGGAAARTLELLEEALERALATLRTAASGGAAAAVTGDEACERVAFALALSRDLRAMLPAPNAEAPRGERVDEPAPDSRHLAWNRPPRGAVLVCDDEARLAMLTAGLLEQHGYTAVTVGTAGAAIEALAGQRIDVMLLDLHLPDGNAHEVIARMGERALRHPVILTSGYAEEDVDPTLLRSPYVVGYLAKPYSMDRLVAVIERALARRAAAAGLV